MCWCRFGHFRRRLLNLHDVALQIRTHSLLYSVLKYMTPAGTLHIPIRYAENPRLCRRLFRFVIIVAPVSWTPKRACPSCYLFIAEISEHSPRRRTLWQNLYLRHAFVSAFKNATVVGRKLQTPYAIGYVGVYRKGVHSKTDWSKTTPTVSMAKRPSPKYIGHEPINILPQMWEKQVWRHRQIRIKTLITAGLRYVAEAWICTCGLTVQLGINYDMTDNNIDKTINCLLIWILKHFKASHKWSVCLNYITRA